MTVLVVILTVVVVVLVVLVAGLLRSHAEMLRAFHELGVSFDPDDATSSPATTSLVDLRTRPGVAAPRATSGGPVDIVGRTPAGGPTSVALTVGGAGESLTLLAFLSSGCQTCAGFWEAFADPMQRAIPGVDAELVILTKGPESESEASIRSLAPRDVRTVMSSEAWTDFSVPVSPYFILVDPAGERVVGEGAASSWSQVANLLRQAAADAGLNASRGRPTKASSANRLTDTDDELRAAGIEPGDPSLYPGQTS